MWRIRVTIVAMKTQQSVFRALLSYRSHTTIWKYWGLNSSVYGEFGRRRQRNLIRPLRNVSDVFVLF